MSSVCATGAPAIRPLPRDCKRPFWSVMIPNYNSTRYLKQTLESILVQDPGAEEMQIEIVDNCSTEDDPGRIVAEMGVGDRVQVFRRAEHVGMSANWNTCIERARGQWVHILHSDDTVVVGFYDSLRRGN